MLTVTGEEGPVLPLGRWFDIPLKIHWTFFALAVLMILSVAFLYQSWRYTVIYIILYLPILFVTTLIHELAHAIQAFWLGGSCELIILWPLGGMTVFGGPPDGTALQEFYVAIAGPFTHLPQMLIWYMVMTFTHPDGSKYFGKPFDIEDFQDGGGAVFAAELGKSALMLNFYIFVLNVIIPAFPLDAARMLAALLVQCQVKLEIAANMVGFAGGGLSVALVMYAITAILDLGRPGWLFLVLGLFLLFTSAALLYASAMGLIHQHPVFSSDCYCLVYGGNPYGGPTHSASRIHDNDPYDVVIPRPASAKTFMRSQRTLDTGGSTYYGSQRSRRSRSPGSTMSGRSRSPGRSRRGRSQSPSPMPPSSQRSDSLGAPPAPLPEEDDLPPGGFPPEPYEPNEPYEPEPEPELASGQQSSRSPSSARAPPSSARGLKSARPPSSQEPPISEKPDRPPSRRGPSSGSRRINATSQQQDTPEKYNYYDQR